MITIIRGICQTTLRKNKRFGRTDLSDIDEKVVENAIIHNVKNFILTFGKDFAFIRNQYHLDAFGAESPAGY